MSLINQTGITSEPAGADYSAINWPRLVVYNASGEFVLCGAGAIAHGCGENFPVKQGEQLRAATAQGWQAKAEVGTGGVTKGLKVYSDGAGKLVMSATAGHIPVGIALETAVAGVVAKFHRQTLAANP